MHCLWAATRRACRPCRATSRKARANGFNKPHLYTVLVSVRNSLTLFYMYVQNAVQTHFFPQTGCELCSLSHSKSRKKIRAGRTRRPTKNKLSRWHVTNENGVEVRFPNYLFSRPYLPLSENGTDMTRASGEQQSFRPSKKAKNGEGGRWKNLVVVVSLTTIWNQYGILS